MADSAPAGGMAVTVRRDRRSPNRWAVYGPTTRRIDRRLVAVSRAGAVLGDARTFGAAVGLVVDAEIEARNEP